MKLTDRKIKSAKATERDLFLSDGAGLYLRVRNSGSKSWLYRYKIANKTRWHELGIYPSMTLSQARLAAHNAKAIRKNGGDPVEEKVALKKQGEERRKKAAAQLTVKQLFDKWLTTDLKYRKDNGQEVEKLFKRHVLPQLGELKSEELTKELVMQVIDNLLKKNIDRTAKLTLSLLRQMFRFALERGIIQNDPTALIRKSKIGKPEKPRDRFLSELEILGLAKAIPDANLNQSTEISIWLTLATGCRIGELLKAKWSDINLDENTWIIPETNSKNNQSLKVHLSKFAVKHFIRLKEHSLSEEWCFPNRTLTSHVCLKTITKQVSDRQLTNDVKRISKRTKNCQALLLSNGKWTPHDLRRTCATMMTSLGTLPDIAEKCLNHKEQNRMKRTYQQHNYDLEKKIAWETLGDRLNSLINQMALEPALDIKK